MRNENKTKKNKVVDFWSQLEKEFEQSKAEGKDEGFWKNTAREFEQSKDEESKIWENEVGSFYAEIEEAEKREKNSDDIDWDEF